MSTLAVAAGGGGDALGILALRNLTPAFRDVAGIATLAWERLRIDPVPGPRGRGGFVGLKSAGTGTAEFSAETDTTPPGRSSLPRLAEESGARLFLLDPEAGAVGLTVQLRHLVQALDVTEVVLVDIGGDVVAEGHEDGLLSPLADALTLQAVSQLDLSTHVLVAGPGLDGELTEHDVLHRVNALGGKSAGTITKQAAKPLIPLLAWHPSEVSALMTAAALGIRGSVDLRRGNQAVPITDSSATAWRLETAKLVAANRIAAEMQGTNSLAEADRVTHRFGQSEITFEHDKASATRGNRQLEIHDDLGRAVRAYARESLDRGRDLITTRRLAEAIALPGKVTPHLVEHLGTVPGSASGPLWNLRALVRAES